MANTVTKRVKFNSVSFLTSEYFVTGPDLWVSNNFKWLITAAYPAALVPRGVDEVRSFDLIRTWSYKKILARREMGGEENVREYAFTPDQIAELIDLQLDGGAGRMITGGYNLFYVIGKGGALFSVSVRFLIESRRWIVDARELGDYGCLPVYHRVFRNTQTFESTEG